jgi:2'-5' RNA ligase
MQYFIGIVPPDEYINKVIEFQKRWENNMIFHITEPHITVKAQGGLTIDEKWLSTVKDVCGKFPSFKVELNKPKFFWDSVLFLSVHSKQVYELHNLLVKAISPSSELIKKYMELDHFEAHLTLGQTYFGLTSKELIEMKKLAEKDLMPYPTFEVNFIRIYREVEQDQYKKYIDIPLLG